MLYRPDRGWGFKDTLGKDTEASNKLDDLLRRVQQLEARSKVTESVGAKKKRENVLPVEQDEASKGGAR